jgi:uncharacterized protein with HEPN domain
MRRDPRSYLWDMRDACRFVLEFVSGADFDEYTANRLLHSAVERQLQNAGEAMSKLSQIDPSLAARVPEHRQLIAFRNVLVHGYGNLDDRKVWESIEDSLPSLCTTLDALLAELGPAPK